MIRCLSNSEIDREAWDRCIRHAAFETLYPYSWYLDLVSPQWDGLVWNEYEGVMPLTRTRKMGMDLLLQPILAQQLGFFAVQEVSASLIRECLQAIPERFRYVDICLNASNPMPAMRRIHVIERQNFQLDLNRPEDAYHTNTRRNLQKGLVHDFRLEEISAETYMGLKFAGPEKVHADRQYLMQLFTSLVGMGRAEILGLYLEGRIHAAAVMSWSETRAIYMNGTSCEAGKESRAMFVLMDRLIQRGRKKAGIFDFEGSDIPGVARFFKGFGGRQTLYPRIIRRRFPFLLKIT